MKKTKMTAAEMVKTIRDLEKYYYNKMITFYNESQDISDPLYRSAMDKYSVMKVLLTLFCEGDED